MRFLFSALRSLSQALGNDSRFSSRKAELLVLLKLQTPESSPLPTERPHYLPQGDGVCKPRHAAPGKLRCQLFMGRILGGRKAHAALQVPAPPLCPKSHL